MALARTPANSTRTKHPPLASRPSADLPGTAAPAAGKPLALIVFLENVGHIHGVNLPNWAMTAIDWLTEEYAKLLLRLFGAYHRYHRVLILEDDAATAANLTAALVEVSASHTVDQLLLVHGQERCLIGYKGRELVDAAAFDRLLARYVKDTSLLDLRMVYGLNCYGASLASTWLALGAQAVNGAHAVNWLPEPSLSLFLRKWLNGANFSEAVGYSSRRARAIGRLLWRDQVDGSEHPYIAGSRQIVYGRRDVTITSPTGNARTTQSSPVRKVAATAHPQLTASGQIPTAD
ncbi:MAG: hypothetical protein F4148_01745 [Caldilineaceae bacterium SB0675_bin_29]|uniref:Uncharacterized protein n=1 Tax=Caldilineaceae bacterium SB0675_bin_29 TaxID=2605266 RepID=A0A6B1FWT6_9CHLR|nr:hypothetical protein [Caldilineaceae bacterium SB0675_bin_29]